MPDITKLQDELEQTIKRREELRSKHHGATLPEAEAQEDVQLHERGLKLRVAIEQEKTAARDRDFTELQSYMNDPVHHIPRAVNPDDSSHKMLEEAGWTFKDGNIYRQTSQGVEIKMYSEDVLLGPIPTNSRDSDVASYFKQTRAIFQPSYRTAYLKFLTSVRMETGMAMQRLSGEEQKVLSEGNDSAGGFLVPPDLQAEMLVRAAQQSVFRRLARVVNTSRDKVIWPRVAAASATESGLASGGASVFSSGFVGGWVGETPAFSDTDPGFGTFEIGIKKLRVATKLSNDFLSDAVINIGSWLAQNGGENMALVEDQGFLIGDGGALQPKGLLTETALQTSGGSVVDVEGSTANTISNTVSDAGSAPKLIDLVYGLPAQYANGAQWLMRRSIEGKIRKLVGGNGMFLWPLQSGSAFGLPNGAGMRALMDYAVNNSDFVPADGTDTRQVAVFGDFSNYIIAQRAQISTQILRERFADTDQTGIIIFERLGGATWNTDAFRCGVV